MWNGGEISEIIGVLLGKSPQTLVLLHVALI